jgi:hypothetical protein
MCHICLVTERKEIYIILYKYSSVLQELFSYPNFLRICQTSNLNSSIQLSNFEEVSGRTGETKRERKNGLILEFKFQV